MTTFVDSLPLVWRARRLMDQVSQTWEATIPAGAYPTRLGIFRLQRAVGRLRNGGAGQIVPVSIQGYEHPIWLRSGTSDLDVALQLFAQHELGFRLDQAPRWIIDLGANIGLSALYFANRFPGARIIALEVEQGNFDLLRRNCAPYPNIIPLHMAVWSESGKVKITNPDAQPWSFRVETAGPEDADGIPAISIEDVMQNHQIDRADLVKMDIEGAEREVLSQNSEGWLSRTDVLAVELHERHRRGCVKALESAIGRVRHSRELLGEYEIIRFERAGT
jgi:FkbM family methyltransferase